METYGFNVDKFEEVFNITSKINELSLKVASEMHKLGVKTEREILDEELHNLSVGGMNGQR